MGVTVVVFGDIQKRKRSLGFNMIVPLGQKQVEALEREQTGAAKVYKVYLAQNVFHDLNRIVSFSSRVDSPWVLLAK